MHEAPRVAQRSPASRITLVTDTFAPDINGVAMTMGQLSHRLAQRGHDVEVVHPDPAPASPVEPEPDPSGRLVTRKVHSIPLPRYPELRLGLPRACYFAAEWRKRRPHAIYVATEGMLGSSAAATARRMGIRVVSGYHTHFPQYLRHYSFPSLEPIAIRFLRRWHNKTAATLVPADDVAKWLRSHGFKNVHLLGRGVDCDLFSPDKRDHELRHQWGAGSKTPVILYVGRVAAEKNLELAFRTHQDLRSRYPDLKLVVVGDGPARPELEAAYPAVIWAGTQRGEALAAHYASADLFVFPSLTETYGNVLVEAMASGLPSLSFNYAASRQWVQHGINGYHVSPGNEEAFTRMLDEIMALDGLWPKIGRSARRSAEQLSWDSVTDTFESVLLGNIDSHSLSPPNTKSAPKNLRSNSINDNIHDQAHSYPL